MFAAKSDAAPTATNSSIVRSLSACSVGRISRKRAINAAPTSATDADANPWLRTGRNSPSIMRALPSGVSGSRKSLPMAATERALAQDVPLREASWERVLPREP